MKAPKGAVLSIDGLTEGTHFRSSWAARLRKDFGLSLGRELGWKLMGSSLSDLAATAATGDRWAMIYLGAPSRTRMDFLMDFLSGVRAAAKEYDCAIVGGDTVKAQTLSLVIAVGGKNQERRVLTRSGARPGDLICVAGRIGDAAAGLAILNQRFNRIPRQAGKYFVEKFFRPRPLIREGEILLGEPGVRSLMDVSDPLDQSLEILCRASSVGGMVDVSRLPVSEKYEKYFGKDTSLLSCGEDYSLLFTMQAKAQSRLAKRLPFAVIGAIHRKRMGIQYFVEGRPCRPARSFRHF